MKTELSPSTLAIAALLLLGACSAPDPKMAEHMAMMKADSAEAAQVAAQENAVRAIFDMINSGNYEGMDNLMTADFVDHQQDPSITTTGIQGVKDMMNLLRGAYPDYKQEVLHMSSSGDRTYVHLRMTGTNTGPWGAMPATGKAMDVMGVDVIRFADGKAAEHWGYMEEMKMMTQLGLMPDPAAAPEAKK